MSPQQKASGGGSRKSGGKGGAGQKDSTVVAAEQSNNQNSTTNKKHNNVSSNVNNTNIDQSKTEKEKLHIKPTAEQIRIAQITEIKNGTQDPTREKVIQLMEATERSEEDACLALYECDNDLERAVIYLLENLEVGALITTTKKKKTKAASDGNEGDEFESSNTNNNRDSNRGSRGDGSDERFKGRISNRGGASNRGRSRVSGGDSRGNQDGNVEGGNNMRGMRGRGDGTRRGGFSGRGRGGRGGPRVRDQNHRMNNYRNNQQPEHQQEIDNWDPSSTQNTNDTKNDETWGDCGDWDNEEYTGSLSDTKVFTPSTQQDLSAPPGLEQQILNPPQSDVNQYNPTVVSSGTASGQYGDLHSASTAAQQLRQALEMPSMSQQASAPLSAEQSQYFNTLGSQNTNAAYQSSVQYQYNDQVVSNQQAPRSQVQAQQQQQQQQQRSRARVPPPSKIPSSAVEMPDVDLPVYLDVQFGGLDFGTGTEEPTYETEKYSQGLDQSTGDDYTANKSNVVTKSSQSALSGLQPSQLIQNAESISSSTQADLSSSYAQRNASSMGATGQSTLDQLAKTGDIYASNTASGNAYQNLSYQSSQKTGGYQTSGYGSNAYNSSQSTNNYPASTNSYGGYNQNSYQQQNQSTQSGTGQQQIQSTGSVSNNSSNPNQTTSGYMGNQYQGNQTGYQSQQSSYQSQSVYGNSNNINSNSDRFSGSINSLTSKLKSTQGTYDSSTNAVSSGTSSTSSNTAITTSSISTSLGLNSAKSTTSTSGMKTGSGSSQVSSSTNVTTNTSSGVGTTANAGNGASNVVQNIPLMSSYIQPAFYQQQPYLHFEDMQLVQPRMTPMTGYYEYQTPTSLAGVRSDGTASNLASVAYPTMSADGRFARTDNNSSPVQSQQTAGSSQLMNLPPYAYFYGTNVMPGSFQQFPQIYSQMPATNPNAGQFAKQSAYNSGYGSTGYDTLNQTAPDYNKTTYQSTGQQTKGHSTTNQSGTNSDIASSMYNKSHVTLNKVNSYDKQSFHSGTPPPFNLGGSQAGSQTQAFQQHLYLQPMAPHHNMHQPIHQMEGGRITNSRRDTNSSGQRQQTGSQSKSGSKPAYSTSAYWNTQN